MIDIAYQCGHNKNVFTCNSGRHCLLVVLTSLVIQGIEKVWVACLRYALPAQKTKVQSRKTRNPSWKAQTIQNCETNKTLHNQFKINVYSKWRFSLCIHLILQISEGKEQKQIYHTGKEKA